MIQKFLFSPISYNRINRNTNFTKVYLFANFNSPHNSLWDISESDRCIFIITRILGWKLHTTPAFFIWKSNTRIGQFELLKNWVIQLEPSRWILIHESRREKRVSLNINDIYLRGDYKLRYEDRLILSWIIWLNCPMSMKEFNIYFYLKCCSTLQPIQIVENYIEKSVFRKFQMYTTLQIIKFLY